MKVIISTLASVVIFTGCSYSERQQSNFDIQKIAVGKGAASVEVADFNKDGKPDIVVAQQQIMIMQLPA